MKLIAEFHTVDEDLKQRITATIVYDSETKKVATSEKDSWILRSITEDGGVLGADQERRYLPKDGEKFMRALPVQYAGTRSWASLREAS